MFSASAVFGGFNTGFSRRRGSVTPASLRFGSNSTSVSPSDSGRKSGLLSMLFEKLLWSRVSVGGFGSRGARVGVLSRDNRVRGRWFFFAKLRCRSRGTLCCIGAKRNSHFTVEQE